MVYTVAHARRKQPKYREIDQILHIGDSCTHHRLGTNLAWESGLLMYCTLADFTFISWYFRHCRAKICKFDWILNFGGSYITPAALHPSGPNLACDSRSEVFRFPGWLYRLMEVRKSQNWPLFQLQHSVVKLPSGTGTKLDAYAQPRTVSYQMVSKSVPYLNA